VIFHARSIVCFVGAYVSAAHESDYTEWGRLTSYGQLRKVKVASGNDRSSATPAVRVLQIWIIRTAGLSVRSRKTRIHHFDPKRTFLRNVIAELDHGLALTRLI